MALCCFGKSCPQLLHACGQLKACLNPLIASGDKAAAIWRVHGGPSLANIPSTATNQVFIHCTYTSTFRCNSPERSAEGLKQLTFCCIFSSVSEPKRLFPDPSLDPTFQIIPDPAPAPDPGQNQIFLKDTK